MPSKFIFITGTNASSTACQNKTYMSKQLETKRTSMKCNL
jgi:hypothetical protein